MEFREITSTAERQEFVDDFIRVVPVDYGTKFDSVVFVTHMLAREEERLFVASDISGNRGFLMMNCDNEIHTMFTLPCTPDNKIPCLFQNMLLALEHLNYHTAVFEEIDGYNGDMMPFFQEAATQAGIGSTTVFSCTWDDLLAYRMKV